MALVNEEHDAKRKTDLDLQESKEICKTTSRWPVPSGLAAWSNRIHPDSNDRSPRKCDYNPASKCQRYWLTTRILAISLLSAVGLLIVVLLDVNEAIISTNRFQKIKEAVDGSIKFADLIHNLQVERGLTVLSISSKYNESIIKKLHSARINTSEAITYIPTWPDGIQDTIFRSKSEFARQLEQHRKYNDLGKNSTIMEEIKYYTRIIQLSLDWLFRTIQENYLANKLFDILGYHTFLQAKDKLGIERALGGSYFAKGHFNKTSEFLSYAETNLMGKSFLQTSMQLSQHLKGLYDDVIIKETLVLLDLDSKRSTILANEPRKGNTSASNHWFSLMTEYINVLLIVQKSAGEYIIRSLQNDVDTQETELLLQSFLLVVVLILIPMMFLAVVRMTSTIQKYAAQLEATTLNLKEEQTRTDNVLSAMFPQPVAESLKKGEKIDSEYFDSVTVFFSDIVNFTNICAMISPMEVTSMLNGIYSAFDDTIDKYDVYKVETIGDAYMVVSGLPIRNGVNHVDQICRMSFDLVQVTHEFQLVEVPGEVLLIRVGIHTGPCVSGIVGNKMPRYCLFGDTVNTASRMQTSGLPQKIHISEGTQAKLIYFKQYETEFRGLIDVKGKGTMKTFWLLGSNTAGVT